MAWTGKQLKHYRLLERRGEGSLGSVYRAHDAKQDAVCAVKIIRPALASDAAFLAHLTQATRDAARLDHPHIVGLHWFFEKPPHPFLVTDYVEGPSLAGLIERRSPLPWRQAVPLFSQILRGLAYAHDKGVAHRNLHPADVLVTREGRVRLTDFGLARRPDGTAPAGAAPHRAALAYLSPEHIRSRGRVDARSDLYAVGAMLYHVLTGLTPFTRHDEDFRLLRAILEEEIRPPSEFVPDLPEALDAFVLKALAREPAQRFASAEAMRAALGALEKSEPVAAGPPAPPPEVPERGRGIFVGGVVATLAVAALLAWWSLRDVAPAAPPPPPPSTPDTLVLTPGLFERVLPANGAAEGQAVLVLQAYPYGTLRLDDQDVGADSVAVPVAPGRYALACTHPRHGTREAAVMVGAGQQKSVTCYFEARVEVEARDAAGSPLRAALFVDEQATGQQTPRPYTLPPGTYMVDVFLDDYLGEARPVVVRPPAEAPLPAPPVAALTFTLQRIE